MSIVRRGVTEGSGLERRTQGTRTKMNGRVEDESFRRGLSCVGLNSSNR